MQKSKKIIRFLVVFVSILGIIFSGKEVLQNRNKDYIDKLVDKYNPVGAAVGIIEDGKIKEIRNYGYADLEHKISVDDNTKFKIASISKTVTSYAIMQLVDEGKLNLDEPVNNYLKKWKIPQSEFDENKVTLRTLMAHTSGLTGSDECGYTYPLPTIEQALKDRDIKLKREPGTVFEYSEFAGLGICQLVIEDVTGEKFEDYMKNNIFKNANMNNTSYDNKSNDNSFAIPYAGLKKPIEITPIVMNGGGGVTTTANDLASFAIELMNYYNTGNKEMFTAQKNTVSTGGRYGLGIIPRKLKNGKTVYEHNGTLTGWNAQLVIEPESKNGIVILTNSDKAFFLTYELMEKWGEEVVGEKIIDTNINHFSSIIYKIIGIMSIVLALIITIFIVKINKGILVLRNGRELKKKYLIWSIISLIIFTIYIIFIYSDIPFKIIFNMENYFLFTFFPPSFIWINILFIIYLLFIIIRSGYKKRVLEK